MPECDFYLVGRLSSMVRGAKPTKGNTLSKITDRASTIPPVIAGTTSTIADRAKHSITDQLDERRRQIAKPYRRRGRIEGLSMGLIGLGIYRYRGQIMPYTTKLTSLIKGLKARSMRDKAMGVSPYGGDQPPAAVDLTEATPASRHSATSGL